MMNSEPKAPKTDWKCRFLQSLLQKLREDPDLSLSRYDNDRLQQCIACDSLHIQRYLEEMKVCYGLFLGVTYYISFQSRSISLVVGIKSQEVTA